MMKFLLTVLSFLCLSTMAVQAQTWDCDCEETVTDSTGVCIQVTLPDSLASEYGVATLDTWLPSECFATCLGFENYVLIDCDSIGFDWEWDDDFEGNDDWTNYDDCDCPDPENEEGICIEVTFPDSILVELDSLFGGVPSFQTWVPSECYAVCCGYTDFTVIDCDSLDYGFDEWDDVWNDDWNEDWTDGCDCEEGDSLGICIEVSFPDSLIAELGGLFGDETSFQTWVPSECHAVCWGYENYTVIDCDSLDNGFDDWEDDWNDDWNDDWSGGCDCEENDSLGICIEVTFSDSILAELGDLLGGETSFQTWVPSECHAICWGYTDYTLIDCDSLDNGFNEWDDEWNDDWSGGCDCEENDSLGICIEVTLPDSIIAELGDLLGDEISFQTWVPSECHATCWGYTDFVIIDCDSIDDGFGDDWEDDGNDDWYDGCDCEENDSLGICITVTLPDSIVEILGGMVGEDNSFDTWVPSECHATCWGYTDFVVIDCDSIDNGFGFGSGLDSLNLVWEECDCEYMETDEPVCVLTDAETGTICPFPNMCYAECAGYSEDDVVDCEDHISVTCVECIDTEINPVCVQDSSGNVFPVPNQCFADCLGLTVIDEGCGEMINGTDGNDDLEIISPEIVVLQAAEDPTLTVYGYRLFPNPVVDQIGLDLELADQTDVTITISNINGQLVKTQYSNLDKGMNNVQFDVSQLTAGIYTINVFNQQRLLSKRFIKQ